FVTVAAAFAGDHHHHLVDEPATQRHEQADAGRVFLRAGAGVELPSHLGDRFEVVPGDDCGTPGHEYLRLNGAGEVLGAVESPDRLPASVALGGCRLLRGEYPI